MNKQWWRWLHVVKCWHTKKTEVRYHLHLETWFVQHVIIFLSSFFYSGLFMSNSADVSWEAEDAYPIDASGPCSQFWVVSELLIYLCYFVCVILVTLCSMLCLSVYHVWSLSLYYICLISARILVPLINLSSQFP